MKNITMKKLKFSAELVPLVISGKKTTTWRLNDDKNLSSGDELELVDAQSLETFAKATIIEAAEKPFSDLTDEDRAGHESYLSNKDMFEWFGKCYKQAVNQDTIVKIVKFKLEN